MKAIPFSPPDISEKEIQAVSEVLRSGWITTGSKVKEFQKKISNLLGGGFSICLNSATAGLELALKLANIQPGDEVITTPYTFAATANVILHLRAKPVFADVAKGSFHIDAKSIAEKITPRTRAVLTVDYGGFPVDFPAIRNMLEAQSHKIFLISDSAHSIGANIYNKPAASFADISVFSFHAVKNITTAEGGCLYIHTKSPFFKQENFKLLKELSLHGMNQDAYDKEVLGSWAYDITTAGYKYNMTDIQAAMGIVQLDRYQNELLAKRRKLFSNYLELFKDNPKILLPPFEKVGFEGSCHLFPIRIKDASEQSRNKIMEKLRERGIATNIHYRPLPLFTLYRKLGYNINDTPNAFEMYQNEITLPLYTRLSTQEQAFIKDKLIQIIHKGNL